LGGGMAKRLASAGRASARRGGLPVQGREGEVAPVPACPPCSHSLQSAAGADDTRESSLAQRVLQLV
jgi:hypothetical protein